MACKASREPVPEPTRGRGSHGKRGNRFPRQAQGPVPKGSAGTDSQGKRRNRFPREAREPVPKRGAETGSREKRGNRFPRKAREPVPKRSAGTRPVPQDTRWPISREALYVIVENELRWIRSLHCAGLQEIESGKGGQKQVQGEHTAYLSR